MNRFFGYTGVLLMAAMTINAKAETLIGGKTVMTIGNAKAENWMDLEKAVGDATGKNLAMGGTSFVAKETSSSMAEPPAAAGDTLKLSLEQMIALAQEQSPSAKSARHSMLAAEWSYKYYRANYLPSVTLTSAPYLNKQINKITQGDGTAMFIKQDQLGADLTLKVNQNIALTGGSLFLTSSLNRNEELQRGTTSYSAQPIQIGYSQSLFGYNYLKWDRRIEPLRYREAKKNYIEAMELVAATACNRFFQWISAQSNLAMARLNFSSADTLYNMARGRFSIGSLNENELLQLEINRLNEETSCMDAEVYLEEQTQSLRSYLGLGQDVNIVLIAPDSVPDMQFDLDRTLALAMENAPDCDYNAMRLLEGKSSLARARANAGLRADLYVQFGLSQRGENMADSYRSPNHQEYVSVSLSLPILDWGRGRGQVRLAKSNLSLIEMNVEQSMQDFRQNVQKLVLQFNMQGRRVAVARRTSQQAEHRYDIARHLYVSGRNTVLDLNAAISAKDSARRGYLNSIQSFWALYYTIRSLTGGSAVPQTPTTTMDK